MNEDEQAHRFEGTGAAAPVFANQLARLMAQGFMPQQVEQALRDAAANAAVDVREDIRTDEQ